VLHWRNKWLQDLEWKIVYVGSADTTQYDQELDSVLVGPGMRCLQNAPKLTQYISSYWVEQIHLSGWLKIRVNVTILIICIQANPPDPAKIPTGDLLGVTVILLQCAYRGNEFVRIGFYVSNDYDDPAVDTTAGPPPEVDYNKIVRNILTSKPRVTKVGLYFFCPCPTYT